MNAFTGLISVFLAAILIAPALLKMAEAPKNRRYATPNHFMIENTKLDATMSDAMPVADNIKKSASAAVPYKHLTLPKKTKK
mgnify:CR=1 FL=1